MKFSKAIWLSIAFVGLSRTVTIFPVTGVHTGIDAKSGAVPPRLRIQDLQKSGPAWDLYIQALDAFKALPEDDPLSYFQISGIHGRPYVAWNGVEQVEGAPLAGYCTHNEVLFAIWHRPLVALFEQVLAQHIQHAATKYQGPNSGAYRSAADSWRQPYWDWALDKALPDILVQENVTIDGPNGTITMKNPLLDYKFKQFPLNETLFPTNCDEKCDENLFIYPETLRCPDPTTNRSDPSQADYHVQYIDLSSQVYNIYSRVRDFESMSTTARDSTSFEHQHNEIHVAVGGLHPMGHFAHLGYSGFDPVFMMHHAAIDRHVALWQAIYYNASMFERNYTTTTGQFATAPATIITANSPLKPFYADGKGNFHTPNSARDIAVFGYTYPELQGSYRSTEKLSLSVTSHVNRLYGPSDTVATISHKNGWSRSHRESSNKEYFIKISIEKSEVKLPAMVRIWLRDNFVGRLLLLDSPKHGLMHAEFSLRRILETRVDTMAGEAVRETVEKYLHWNVATFDGRVIPLSQSPSLSISVRVEDITIPESSQYLPLYANVRTIWESTESRDNNH